MLDAGSVLTSSTFLPELASLSAVAHAAEVLPTPPFPVKKRNRGVFSRNFMPGSGNSAGCHGSFRRRGFGWRPSIFSLGSSLLRLPAYRYLSMPDSECVGRSCTPVPKNPPTGTLQITACDGGLRVREPAWELPKFGWTNG